MSTTMESVLNVGIARQYTDITARKKTGIYAMQPTFDDAVPPPTVAPGRRLPTEFLKDRTNTERRLPSSPPSLTTDTTRTPSHVSPSQSTSKEPDPISPSRIPSRSLSPHTRRELRYTRAQSALAATLALCHSGPSQADLQIRALQSAAALLSAQAQDARERAAKLRELLQARQADGQDEIEPEEWKAMQRERWLAERRSTSREEQAKVVNSCLMKLTGSQDGHMQHEEAYTTGSRSLSRRQTRRKANITHFFERSPTVLSFAPRAAFLPRHKSVVMMQRRKTMNRVRSLKLRTTACALAPSIQHVQLDSQEDGLDTITNGVHPNSQPEMPSSSTRDIPRQTRTPHTPPPLQPEVCPRPVNPRQASSSGTASILPPSTPRTKAQLLAALDRDPAGEHIPQYAVALLDELVASELDVTLGLPANEAPGTQTVRGRTQPGPSGSESTGRGTQLKMGAAASAPDVKAAPSASPKKSGVRAKAFRRSLHVSSADTNAGEDDRAAPRPTSSLSSVPESLVSEDVPVAHSRTPSRLSVLSFAGDFAVVSKVRNRLSVFARK